MPAKPGGLPGTFHRINPNKMTQQPKTGGQHAPEFSPKLKMIAAQIKKILVDNDVAGAVHIYEPGFNEMAIHINPSFSVVGLNETNQLKINPPIDDPTNPEPAKKKIADTVNMLANLRLRSGQLSLTFTQAEMTVRGHFGIKSPKPPPRPNIVNPNIRKNGRGY